MFGVMATLNIIHPSEMNAVLKRGRFFITLFKVYNLIERIRKRARWSLRNELRESQTTRSWNVTLESSLFFVVIDARTGFMRRSLPHVIGYRSSQVYVTRIISMYK